MLRSERERVYDAFTAYRTRLQMKRRCDWDDVPHLVLDALNAGLRDGNRYDAILIDEAQDFAPSWFEVLKRLLNPETGVLFLAADATQRIYRRFSWRAMGLNVVGRTRVLHRPYRNTYEIMLAAHELIRHNDTLVLELAEEDEDLLAPDMDPDRMRHDIFPVLRACDHAQAERRFLVKQITRLLENGYQPGDIAIFGLKTTLKTYGPALQREGIPVAGLKNDSDAAADSVAIGSLHSAKGLEFRVVFIVQGQAIFETPRRLSDDERAALEVDRLRLLYVGMTRAREKLCLSYYGPLPRQLRPLKAFLDEAESMMIAGD